MNALIKSLAGDETVPSGAAASADVAPAHDAGELLDISRRYASLPPERRRAFRERLRAHGFDVAQLPVVALPDEDDASADAPLSPAQERLWFLWRLNPASAAYNMSGVLRLKGAIDVSALRATFAALVTRHASLRTRFVEVDGEPRQRVDSEPTFGWAEQRLVDQSDSAIEAVLDQLAWRPFDLEHGPLLRVDLVRTESDEQRLLISMHHIVSDGWSIGVLFAEFLALYEAAVTSADREPRALEARAELEPLRVQYADYARWQREWFDDEALAEQLDYWRTQLAPVDVEPLALPFDRSRSGARDTTAGTRAGTVSASVPAATVNALRHFAGTRGTTLFAALLAAFDVLLHRYTGSRDVRVGVPVAGRHGAATTGLIGFFVNTIVMRASLRASDTYAGLLDQVSARLAKGQCNQDLPFARLVEALQPVREPGRTPLFDVMFNLRQHPSHRAALPGLEVESVALNVDAAQFDFSLNAAESARGIDLSFDFASDVFDASTVERLLAHYASILDEAARAPDTRIGAFALVPDDGVALREETARHVALPFEPVTVSIESQARVRPDAIAVCCDGESLTYAQLDAWSNRIAHRLVALGVQRDERVGVSLDRSCALVAALLGVLKAGGAYVPLDPSYPAGRLSAMIADAGVQRVVLQERNPVFDGCELVQVDEVGNESSGACNVAIDAQQLAYVIFTSGSTGRPKGVGITHANVSRLLSATRAQFAFDEHDVWTLFHSYAFDFSVWELFGALVHGARLVVVPYWSARDTRAFHALLREERVTVLNQ
ncbi:condensation domain-containing protein, partial [Paraburkholderia nemoris]